MVPAHVGLPKFPKMIFLRCQTDILTSQWISRLPKAPPHTQEAAKTSTRDPQGTPKEHPRTPKEPQGPPGDPPRTPRFWTKCEACSHHHARGAESMHCFCPNGPRTSLLQNKGDILTLICKPDSYQMKMQFRHSVRYSIDSQKVTCAGQQ